MLESQEGMDLFVSWLCSHECDVVGRPGMCFHAPLALWLSEWTGNVYGVDDHHYGVASKAHYHWRPLPCWAKLFIARLEHRAFRPMTGSDALLALAEVELMLSPLLVVSSTSH